MKTHHDSFKIYNPSAQMHLVGTPPTQWRDGSVATPIGIVTVYSQESGKDMTYTSFDFVHNGRLFRRRIHKIFTDRGIATKAHRFAKEVIQGRVKP